MTSFDQPLKDLEKRETVSRKEYDYQIKARAQTLRVLAHALVCIENNHKHHYEHDDHGGYEDSELCQLNILNIQILKTSLGL